MQRRSVPDDILKSAAAIFRAGERRDDAASQIALGKFLFRFEDGLLTPAKARKFLSDDGRVNALIGEAKKFLAETQEQSNSKILFDSLLLLKRMEAKLIELDERHTQSVTTLTKNTDPVANNKSSFWINIRAGAIYFIAGLIASPVGSILLKRPLDDFDKWFNDSHLCRVPRLSYKKQRPQHQNQKNKKTKMLRWSILRDRSPKR